MDDRTLELIHGAIDGANSPADQHELMRCLEASAEAQREYEQLQRLCGLLDAEPEFAPPAGLRESILAEFPRREAQVSTLRPRPRRAWLGAAVALAASAAGVALLVGRAPELTELEPSVLSGTMGRSGADARVPSLRLDGTAISGTISLHRGDGRLALEVDLDATRPVAIVASAGGAPLEIDGFVQFTGEPAEVSEIGGRTRLLHNGNQRYALVLSGAGPAPANIELAIYDGDLLVHEGRLNWPAEITPEPE